ncbi:MAG: tRNA (adenosine(37)-N6)-threonylcarbamoyltransferase complex ATPase subunit type 1 TsaE [Acidimicrobiales bacterium]
MAVMPSHSSIVLATRDARDTQAVAKAIAPLCVPGDVLLLVGDLGSGKTTFAQGFGRALGISAPITSPTFTLVRQYILDDNRVNADGNPVTTLLHADVYRLDHLHEIADLGLGELVEDGGVALVEWGDEAMPILGIGSLSVRLASDADDPDDRRAMTIGWQGPPWAGRSRRLEEVLRPWKVDG